jgi:hypothetical protein
MFVIVLFEYECCFACEKFGWTMQCLNCIIELFGIVHISVVLHALVKVVLIAQGLLILPLGDF